MTLRRFFLFIKLRSIRSYLLFTDCRFFCNSGKNTFQKIFAMRAPSVYSYLNFVVTGLLECFTLFIIFILLSDFLFPCEYFEEQSSLPLLLQRKAQRKIPPKQSSQICNNENWFECWRRIWMWIEEPDWKFCKIFFVNKHNY